MANCINVLSLPVFCDTDFIATITYYCILDAIANSFVANLEIYSYGSGRNSQQTVISRDQRKFNCVRISAAGESHNYLRGNRTFCHGSLYTYALHRQKFMDT